MAEANKFLVEKVETITKIRLTLSYEEAQFLRQLLRKEEHSDVAKELDSVLASVGVS